MNNALRLGYAGLLPFVAGAVLLWLVRPEVHPYVALALLVCYAVDRRLYPVQGLARWLTLRFRLSAVAATCCFVGAAGS